MVRSSVHKYMFICLTTSTPPICIVAWMYVQSFIALCACPSHPSSGPTSWLPCYLCYTHPCTVACKRIVPRFRFRFVPISMSDNYVVLKFVSYKVHLYPNVNIKKTLSLYMQIYAENQCF